MFFINVLDELKILVSVSADGVKKGLYKATEEVKKFQNSVDTIKTNLDLKADSSGINKAKNETEKLKREIGETSKSIENTSQSFTALGITATAVLGTITIAIKKGIEEFNRYTSAMSGLKSQIAYVGEDMNKATEIMKESTKDGLISESDVAMSIKNLTLYGYSLEQANDIINRLKDSASYNRQAHYELGEAVKVTTDGIKNENSILSDAAGVTKNIAKMKEEYAKSIEKTSESLTQAEKAQAVYLGIMQETQPMLGNAVKYSEELGGSMAENAAKTKKLAQSIGSAFSPVIKDLTSVLTESKITMADFINNNQGLVSGSTVSVVVLSSLVTVFKLVKVHGATATLAVKGFVASLGPIGIALTAISVGVGIFTAIKTEITKLKEEQNLLNEEVEKFNTLINTDTNDNNITQKRSYLEQLEKAKEEYEQILIKYENANKNNSPFYRKATDNVLGLLLKDKESVEQFKTTLSKAGIEVDKFLSSNDELSKGLEKLDITIKKLEDDTSGYTEKLEFNINLDNLAKSISSIENLSSTYEKLATSQNLTGVELTKLITQYPELARYISKTNDLTLSKGEILQDVIQAELKSQEQALNLEQQRISQAISNTEKEIKLKKELQATQNTIDYSKTEKEIESLTQRVSEYENQNITLASAINVLSGEINGFENSKLISEYKVLQSELDNLSSVYETLSKRQSLDYEQCLNLMDTYPKLQKYISETGDITFKSGQLILEVVDNLKNAHSEKRQSLIADCKAQMVAIQEELSVITTAYEKEKVSIIQLMKARKELNSSGVISSEIGVISNNSAIEEYKKYLDEETSKIQQKIDRLEVMGSISSNATFDLPNEKTNSTKAVEKQTSELDKQLKLFNELKETTELTNKEQLSYLEKIKNNYIKTTEETKLVNSLIYSMRKSVNDDWYKEEISFISKLNKGREDNTDFSGIIEKYKNLIEQVKVTYKDYPKTLKSLTDELNVYIVQATESRITKIQNMEKESINNRLNDIQEHIATLKKLNGIDLGNGEIISFNTEDEVNLLKQGLDEITKVLDEFISEKGTNTFIMADNEKSYYEHLLSLQKDYNSKYLDAIITSAKEQKQVLEDEQKEKFSLMETYFKNEQILFKEKNEKLLENIKSRYKKEIELAKHYSDEEVDIYENRIIEIDNLLKQMNRSERDTDSLDQIKRAEEQLLYEKSDANKYELQKEIENLKSEYSKNQYKDSLEDEKSNLKEQIKNLKDTNNQKIEELQKQRDLEIEQTNLSLESYIKSLNDRLEKEKATNLEATSNLNINLSNRLEETKKVYKRKENLTRQNMQNEVNIIESYTNKIINMLYSSTSYFSSIGTAWGNAVADSYNSAISSMMNNVGAYAYDVSSASSSNNYNIEFNQTITNSTSSPSRIRKETETLLNNARYYI